MILHALPQNSFAATVLNSSGIMGLAIMLVILFTCSAAIGSFVNACAMRLVRGEDVVFARSRCRSCAQQLGVLENLPVIGYLRHLGRCHCGKTQIGARYFGVETGFALLIINYALILPPLVVVGFAIAATCFSIAVLTDLEAMILHPALLVMAAMPGCGLAAIHAWQVTGWHTDLADAMAGVVVGAGVPILANSLYRWRRGQNGFGQGDFWLSAAVGAWLGPIYGLLAFLIACCIGAAIGIYLIIRDRANAVTRLPFGVFLGGTFLLFPNILLLFPW